MRSALLIKLCLVTAATVTAAFYAMASVHIRGLAPKSFMAAEIVRQRCPIHLVDPALIPGHDQADILSRWSVAEIRARMAVLSLLWMLAVMALAWQYLRKRKLEKS